MSSPSLCQPLLRGAKRAVVKIGSALIAGNGQLEPNQIQGLTAQVAQAINNGTEVVLVVSGAVAAGFRSLGHTFLPSDVVDRQASAAVGQIRLLSEFSIAFERHGLGVSQLLVMEEDIEDRRRFLSARHTINRLLEKKVIPIVNENDPLADDEAKIGDNDHLAAYVANLVSADLLVILSSVDGVRRNGGKGSIIGEIAWNAPVDEHVAPTTSEMGTGGMTAKVAAAQLAARWGVPAIVANGLQDDILEKILDGEEVGTLFVPTTSNIRQRKRWIAFRSNSRGTITIDTGAARALREKGASLLPAGVISVEGTFAMGDRVDIKTADGRKLAVGLSSYPSQDVARMQGRNCQDLDRVLGYRYVDCMVHRDDLVLLESSEYEATI